MTNKFTYFRCQHLPYLFAIILGVIISLFYLIGSYQFPKSFGEVLQFASSRHHPFTFPESDGKLKFSFPLYGATPRIFCPSKTTGNLSDVAEHDQLVGQQFVSVVESSVLFEFSPIVNAHVRKMFNEEIVNNEPWFTPRSMQVSCLPFASTLHCIVRVWFMLKRFSTFRNRFQDNYFYAFELDEQLNYVPNSGRFVGIPSPVNELWYTGPEDPRLTEIDGKLYVNYINGQNYEGVQKPSRHQFLWSLEENVIHDIKIENYWGLNVKEKNWSPLIVISHSSTSTKSDQFYFVYQLLPVVRILKCDFRKHGDRPAILSCSFVIGKPDDPMEPLDTSSLVLRGGSPFIHYEGDYYLAVTHSVQWLNNNLVYAAQFTLLNMHTSQVVLVTSPIFVHPEKMNSMQQTVLAIVRPYFYVRSVYFEKEGDSVVLAGGINDAETFLVRVKGISKILNEAIEEDAKRLAATDFDCSTTTNSSAYGRMLQSAYESLDKWLRYKTLEEIKAQLEKKE